MYKKGSVVLVPFPFTDLSGQKVRPAIILAHPNKSDDVIVVFISSRNIKKKFSFDIILTKTDKAFDATGLKVNSVIKLNKIATLDKKIILGELGCLSADMYKKVQTKLKKLFDL